MDFGGSHFEYAGISSRDYSLIFANVETGRNTSIAGEISTNTFYGKGENKKYYINDKKEDSPISLEIEIITDDGGCIPLADQREIEKWLFVQTQYKKMYLDKTDDCYGETTETIDGVEKRLYLMCRFLNAEKLEYNGGIVGYKCTMETDTGLAWQDEIVKTFTFGQSESYRQIELELDTDVNDYTYPKIEVTMKSTGDSIEIVNNTDDSTSERICKFEGLTPGAIFTFKGGDLNYVNPNYYTKMTHRNFVRLLDGNNVLTITGNISSITFTWNNRRFI